MRKLILILLLCPVVASAQRNIQFAAGTTIDSASTPGWLVPKIGLRLPFLANTDSNRVLSFDAQGFPVWRQNGGGSDGNNYPTTLSFNSGTGNLTLGRNGLSSIAASLDGRYALQSAASGTNTGDQTLSISGQTLTISGANGNSVTIPAGGGGTVDTTRFSDFYRYRSELVFTPLVASDGFIITKVGTDSLFLTVPPLRLSAGGTGNSFSSYFTQNSVNNVALANGQAIYLDVADPFNATFSAPVAGGTVKASINRILFVQNINGKLLTSNESIGNLIKAAERRNALDAVSTDRTVCASGCNYTTIQGAIDSIADASEVKQYRLLIKNGTYNVTGTGLVLKDYVSLIGQQRDSVIVNSPQLPTGQEITASLVHIPATCTLANMTMRAKYVKYVIHADFPPSLRRYDLTCINVVMRHDSSRDGYFHAIGAGLYPGQKLRVYNSDLGTNIAGRLRGGFYIHNSAGLDTRDTTRHFESEFVGCTMPIFQVQDYGEYSPNIIRLAGNVIDSVYIEYLSTVYNANPTDRRANRGVKAPLTTIQAFANRIGTQAYVNTTDTVRFGPSIGGTGTSSAGLDTSAADVRYVRTAPTTQQTAAPNINGPLQVGTGTANGARVYINNAGASAGPGGTNNTLTLEGDAVSLWMRNGIYGTQESIEGSKHYWRRTAFGSFFTGVPTMVFDIDDQVGINTASPAATLDVNGTFRVKVLPEYADDAAAAAGTPAVCVGCFYRTGSFVKQRIN